MVVDLLSGRLRLKYPQHNEGAGLLARAMLMLAESQRGVSLVC